MVRSSCMIFVGVIGALLNLPVALGWAANGSSSPRPPSSSFSAESDAALSTTKTFTASRRETLVAAGTGMMSAALVLVGADGNNIVPAAYAADTGAEVRGIAITPLNGLAFQYRESESAGQGFLKASDLNEPSISYGDFVAKMKEGQVDFVEFLAPDGNVAYASMKGAAKPIRIGEGYPVEQHDGWSSPAFAVRTVKNCGVPYKFTVPALSAYKQS
mmetsp:Transcript_3485/g.4632  ORF Transcript_3485/g.4632 Transcript_3485/m.4632 type:complete len:216 (+) Transcript_3485:74-721(+)|eukprot:CAMPEP_0198143686 /NCGR_PEP_ID=MMETSP1443-20131203/9427_1 /TAXON_ID=186043 /ORGANISM="Entomoneis sp., Strain CCMP2396" /LENGTH=215 /DNA_ID=CAMNT_0043806959 /DNA_START=40 /DNA_END=687 /DNA_ORIENTATION=-